MRIETATAGWIAERIRIWEDVLDANSARGAAVADPECFRCAIAGEEEQLATGVGQLGELAQVAGHVLHHHRVSRGSVAPPQRTVDGEKQGLIHRREGACRNVLDQYRA